MKYELTLMKNPANTWSFAGSVPVKLGWLNKDNSELSDSQAEELKTLQSPALKYKCRVFKTKEDAENTAQKMGISCKVLGV